MPPPRFAATENGADQDIRLRGFQIATTDGMNDPLQYDRDSFAPWADGRLTAGKQSAQAKNNEQLPETGAESVAVRAMVMRGLERSPSFFSAALPKTISPPLFNRYGGAANRFGNHVDGSARSASARTSGYRAWCAATSSAACCSTWTRT